MSGVVLDTHTLVWLFSGNLKLGLKSRQIITQAALQDNVNIPSICIWEIGMLVHKGRLNLDRDVSAWVAAALKLQGVSLAPLSPSVALATSSLPGTLHKDPADRIIVATAIEIGATLVTADDLLLRYGKRGHVRVADARK